MLIRTIWKISSPIRRYSSYLREIVMPNFLQKISAYSNFSLQKLRFELFILSLATSIATIVPPIAVLQMFDSTMESQNLLNMEYLIAIGILAVLAEIALRMFRSYLIGWSGASQEHATYLHVIKQLLNAKDYTKIHSNLGQNWNYISSISRMNEFYSGQSLATLADLPFLIVIISCMYYLFWQIALVPIIFIILMAWKILNTDKDLNGIIENKELNDKQKLHFLMSVFDGTNSIKSTGYEDKFCRRYEDFASTEAEYHYKLTRIALDNNQFAKLYTFASLILIAIIGFINEQSVGIVFACIMLNSKVTHPLQRLLELWVRIKGFRVFKDHVVSITQIPNKNINAEATVETEGLIEIKDVSFAFNEKSNLIFHHLNVVVNRGETVAISGGFGSGKSTLLMLFAGLVTPISGSIILDEEDLDSYPTHELTKHIGYLPISPIIYKGSVLDNITGFGSCSMSEALEISHYLGIDEEVSLLPNGYDTLIEGGDGDTISYNLQQLITIARSLAKKPKVILYDHADEYLTRDSYFKLYRLLGRIKSRVALIMVTEDRNLLNLADKHYYIENKQLRQIGENDT
jgi:ATP-binding cassette subfamily C protein LapB